MNRGIGCEQGGLGLVWRVGVKGLEWALVILWVLLNVGILMLLLCELASLFLVGSGWGQEGKHVLVLALVLFLLNVILWIVCVLGVTIEDGRSCGGTSGGIR